MPKPECVNPVIYGYGTLLNDYIAALIWGRTHDAGLIHKDADVAFCFLCLPTSCGNVTAGPVTLI